MFQLLRIDRIKITEGFCKQQLCFQFCAGTAGNAKELCKFL